MNKFLGCLVFLSMTTSIALAQSGSDSPYSQFGLGDLTDQGVGFNKGMGGVGIAFRKGNEVNPLNPASYSSIDSVTMIFDAGFSGQLTNFKENNKKENATSGGFDYVVASLRVIRNLGFSFGVMPYSNIGYGYSTSTSLSDVNATVSSSYSGEGGLSQIFVGAGYRVLKPLSVGFNVAYLWGDYRKTVQTSGGTYVNTLSKQYEADISSYRLEVGAQFEQAIGKNERLTIGATFSPGHKLGSDPLRRIINTNSTISKADTTTFTVSDGLELPTTFGVGLGWQHGATLRFGADFKMQQWGSLSYPADVDGGYALKSDLLKDSYAVNVGAEWMPNPMSRRLLGHVRYRIGAGYSTPYYYINGKDGPKQLHLSLGFGVPIMNGYNNRSILNVSASWQHRSADQLITENTFRINIGLTFNERWFAKWKVE